MRIVQLCLAAAMAASLPNLTAQESYEPPPKFTATALLGAAGVKGANYQIAEAVRTEEYFHEFTIASPYGSFETIGLTQVPVRIQEITALAALEEVSKTEVFLSAAGQSVVNIGKGAAAAVKDPEATVKGLGAGIKRVGVNLGRRAERATESAGEEKSADEGSAAGSAAGSVLGVNAAMRRWARKVGVDPYTTNVVLRKALDDIAKVDAAGSIATKVAVPVPGVVGMTAAVGDIVWGKDPEEVRKNQREGPADPRCDAVGGQGTVQQPVVHADLPDTFHQRSSSRERRRCHRLRPQRGRLHERARGTLFRRERRDASAVARSRTGVTHPQRFSGAGRGLRRWTGARAAPARLDSLDRGHSEGPYAGRCAGASGAQGNSVGAGVDGTRVRTRSARASKNWLVGRSKVAWLRGSLRAVIDAEAPNVLDVSDRGSSRQR